MRRVWILNLDAERELAASGSYETPKRLVEQIAQEVGRVRDALCPGEATLSTASAGDLESAVAIAWCPTPSARSSAGRAGLPLPGAPSLEVLRRVNHRRFALELAERAEVRALYDALTPYRSASVLFESSRSFVDLGSPLARDIAWLEAEAVFEKGFRLKRGYGFAGKGQRRLEAPLRDDDRRWVSDALRLGGFAREPEVALFREISQHGYVDERALLLGAPCVLRCDRFGAPLDVARAQRGELEPALEGALRAALTLLGRALRGAGYFGPFGLDSRLFDSRVGPGLTLVGDVNARFTMGWSIGMGEGREEALELLVRHP